MEPDEMMFIRTAGLLHHLSYIGGIIWLRRDRRGLSLSRVKSRDSTWAERFERGEMSVKQMELNVCATHLHAPPAHVLDGVSIVHKCHVEWGPV